MELVDQLFNNREERLAEAHQKDFAGKDFGERVRTLAEIQDQKGYMVKVEELPDGSYELIEYNCPIFQVANQYNHACQCAQLVRTHAGCPGGTAGVSSKRRATLRFPNQTERAERKRTPFVIAFLRSISI